MPKIRAHDSYKFTNVDVLLFSQLWTFLFLHSRYHVQTKGKKTILLIIWLKFLLFPWKNEMKCKYGIRLRAMWILSKKQVSCSIDVSFIQRNQQVLQSLTFYTCDQEHQHKLNWMMIRLNCVNNLPFALYQSQFEFNTFVPVKISSHSFVIQLFISKFFLVSRLEY